MYNDLVEKTVTRRLRALADEPAEAPYDWAEFQRKRDERSSGSTSASSSLARSLAVLVFVSAAAALIAGFAIASLSHHRTLVSAPASTARLDSGSNVGTDATRQVRPDALMQAESGAMRQAQTGAMRQAQTRAMPRSQPDTMLQARRQPQAQERSRAAEVWLASLPHDRTIIRVGEHAAVGRLQDQIAALDDLMSAERVSGAQPTRLDALEQQRAQLVSSLAQVRYAEMLASATP